MNTTVSRQIIDYVERAVIPQYAGFDKAHREDHVRLVISQSLDLAVKMPHLNAGMVYVVAAFHDLGLVNGRENHHRDSRTILESDPFLQKIFTPDQIRIMGEAVEDHRASNQVKPRNDYGLVVAEADRFIDTVTIVRRTIQYGLVHYPELDKEGQYRRAKEHLVDKYGPDGYLKIWIPWSDNAGRLKDLHRIIADEPVLRDLFELVYTEESAH